MCAARWLDSAICAASASSSRVAAAAVDLARRQFGLRAQARQRRLQLVRGVGEEVALQRDGAGPAAAAGR
jgi:hypothetical protein